MSQWKQAIQQSQVKGDDPRIVENFNLQEWSRPELKKLCDDAGVPRSAIDSVVSIVHQHPRSLIATLSLVRMAVENADVDSANIIEIGVGEGGAAIAMAITCPQAIVTCIDPFVPYTETGRNTVTTDGFTREHFDDVVASFPAGIRSRIRCIQKPSDDAHQDIEDGSIDLVYVDGNHTYQNCKDDILNYLPKVKQGGILGGHDYGPWFPGVIKSVDDMLPNAQVFDATTVWWQRI